MCSVIARNEAIPVFAIATLREGSAYVVPPLYETLRERNDILHLIIPTDLVQYQAIAAFIALLLEDYSSCDWQHQH
ncbi:MAG: hypothetical protein RMY31_009330 [Dendronalium sp. ChiSLP03b]|nr:hypothetical protein [Dendronalium sp. ChiSLP03b]MDZ8206175.1 hypothetical protein [Dendronalium sp. ChiSLP03b]